MKKLEIVMLVSNSAYRQSDTCICKGLSKSVYFTREVYTLQQPLKHDVISLLELVKAVKKQFPHTKLEDMNILFLNINDLTRTKYAGELAIEVQISPKEFISLREKDKFKPM